MYVLIQRLTYVAVVKHIDFVLFSFSTFYVFDTVFWSFHLLRHWKYKFISSNLKVMSKNMLSRVHKSIAFCVSNRKNIIFIKCNFKRKMLQSSIKKLCIIEITLNYYIYFQSFLTLLIHCHEAILSLLYPIIPESFPIYHE